MIFLTKISFQRKNCLSMKQSVYCSVMNGDIKGELDILQFVGCMRIKGESNFRTGISIDPISGN